MIIQKTRLSWFPNLSNYSPFRTHNLLKGMMMTSKVSILMMFPVNTKGKGKGKDKDKDKVNKEKMEEKGKTCSRISDLSTRSQKESKYIFSHTHTHPFKH